MATLFKRLTVFCNTNKKEIITLEQRSILGKIVFDNYVLIKPPKEIMFYTKGIDEEGQPYKVRDYPNYFNPTIDKLIQEYYDNLPKPKVRKRIAVKSKLIFTSKSLQ